MHKKKTFTPEEFQQELDKLEWISRAEYMEQNPNVIDWNKDPPYYLYRGSVRPTTYAGSDNIIFAAPFIRDGMERYFNDSIKNFPIKCGAIVRVYEGRKDNKFYADDSIPDINAGLMKDHGILATDIIEFDPKIHQDTNVINNKKTETIFILNQDGPRNMVAKTTIRSKLFIMMKTNEIKDNVKKIDFSKETLQEDAEIKECTKTIRNYRIQQGVIKTDTFWEINWAPTEISETEYNEAVKRLQFLKANQKIRKLTGHGLGAKFGGLQTNIRENIAPKQQKV